MVVTDLDEQLAPKEPVFEVVDIALGVSIKEGWP
jgi:hypothetical protein